MSKDTQTPADYLFAQATDETRRLKRQAEFLSRFTHSLLDAAGITSGMKVLDVGTGIGDVAFMVAERVGPQGCQVPEKLNIKIRANKGPLADHDLWQIDLVTAAASPQVVGAGYKN